MTFFVIIVGILMALAIFDLIVGVSNDAANFLNSSLGSRVAPRKVILAIAMLGILVGVTFSSGMMEVARKGIFHPGQFYMSEIMFICLGVMLTDVLLLDSFNRFGLPTSTTVSVIFELLGAATAVALVKIFNHGQNWTTIADFINSKGALVIVAGILSSVVVAFFCGALVQFFVRLVFTFDFEARIRRYGAIWGGIVMAMILYFIVIKGAKGASFLSPQDLLWIRTHTGTMLLASFAISVLVLQLAMWIFNINILVPIVLAGTFALAMAFAANDLVNFIGVPLAGLAAYEFGAASDNPLSTTMEALAQPVQTNTYLLVIAGSIMAVTLWYSRKARTVSQTEVSLVRQDEGLERFSSSNFSRKFVRMILSINELVMLVTPGFIKSFVRERFSNHRPDGLAARQGAVPSFDLLRASVNMMVASALISFATSLKLPLSTTYVTFMVSMGSSFSDQAWGRESAVYRVSGVMTVIGGWFFTALAASTTAFVFAGAIALAPVPALVSIFALGAVLMWHNSRAHEERLATEQEVEIFNLQKITSVDYAVQMSFKHSGQFLRVVLESLDLGLEGLFQQDYTLLRKTRNSVRKIQLWANVIIANIFKTLRLLQKDNGINSGVYAETIKALQRIADGHRDIIMKGFVHVDNNHQGLLSPQIEELRDLKQALINILTETSSALIEGNTQATQQIREMDHQLVKLVVKLEKQQLKRIANHVSKTRLTILYLGILEDIRKISRETISLLEVLATTKQRLAP